MYCAYNRGARPVVSRVLVIIIYRIYIGGGRREKDEEAFIGDEGSDRLWQRFVRAEGWDRGCGEKTYTHLNSPATGTVPFVRVSG